jgi:hypothetical protein
MVNKTDPAIEAGLGPRLVDRSWCLVWKVMLADRIGHVESCRATSGATFVAPLVKAC